MGLTDRTLFLVKAYYRLVFSLASALNGFLGSSTGKVALHGA